MFNFYIDLRKTVFTYKTFDIMLDCKDDDDSCEHWESLGYCKKSSEFYPFMSQKCPKSCKICKACPTPEPPNKDLPPTPQGCSESKHLVHNFKLRKFCFVQKITEYIFTS